MRWARDGAVWQWVTAGGELPPALPESAALQPVTIYAFGIILIAGMLDFRHRGRGASISRGRGTGMGSGKMMNDLRDAAIEQWLAMAKMSYRLSLNMVEQQISLAKALQPRF